MAARAGTLSPLQSAPTVSTSSGAPEIRPAIELHTAPIRAAAVDAGERLLATGSEDKTVRIWRLSDGTHLKTLRLPSIEGSGGKVYALAMSPDGSVIVAGGYTAAIFVFRVEDGKLIQRIDDLPQSVTALAFAPDGERLVAGFARGGIATFVWANGILARAEKDEGYGGAVSGLAFDASGRLATASADGYVRTYDRSSRRTRQTRLAFQPVGIAVAPETGQLALGSRDGPFVQVLNADLTVADARDMTSVGTNALSQVAWLRGETVPVLVAGGMFRSQGSTPLAVWPKGRDLATLWPGIADDTVGALVPLSSGDLVVATMEPTVLRLSRLGRPRWQQGRGAIVDFRGQEQTLQISEDGSSVRFARGHLGKDWFVYPPVESGPTSAAPEWHRARLEGLAVSDWKNGAEPKLDGRPLALPPGETARSLAIAPDAQQFALGSDWGLRVYDRKGAPRWQVDTASAVWAVNISPDGRLVVSALGDGTVRWYDAAHGRLLLCLFFHPASEEWAAWTPEGFFYASKHGQNLIGYQFNQGRRENPLFLLAGQLGKQFYRPDLAQRSLEAEDRAVLDKEFVEAGTASDALEAGLPPDVEVLASEVIGDQLRIRYKLIDRGGGIGQVRFRVNERLLLPIQTRAPGPPAPQGETISEQIISLPPGTSVISLLAENKEGNVRSTQVPIKEVHRSEEKRGTLHVLAIAVSLYDQASFRDGVKYAVEDAKSIIDVIETHQADLFMRVDPIVLSNPALPQIQKAFADVTKKVRPEDTYILYLAGHGEARAGRYHFISREIKTLDAPSLEKSLTETILLRHLETIQAKNTLVLLDTCSAGAALPSNRGAFRASVNRLQNDSGIVFIAAAADSEKALELPKAQHSAFAEVVMEALQGDANRKNDGFVDVDELGDYLHEKLPRRTHNIFGYTQLPVIRGNGFFPVTVGR